MPPRRNHVKALNATQRHRAGARPVLRRLRPGRHGAPGGAHRHEPGADPGLATVPVGTAVIGIATATIPVGLALQRWGRRPVLLLGSLSSGLWRRCWPHGPCSGTTSSSIAPPRSSSVPTSRSPRSTGSPRRKRWPPRPPAGRSRTSCWARWAPLRIAMARGHEPQLDWRRVHRLVPCARRCIPAELPRPDRLPRQRRATRPAVTEPGRPLAHIVRQPAFLRRRVRCRHRLRRDGAADDRDADFHARPRRAHGGGHGARPPESRHRHVRALVPHRHAGGAPRRAGDDGRGSRRERGLRGARPRGPGRGCTTGLR